MISCLNQAPTKLIFAMFYACRRGNNGAAWCLMHYIKDVVPFLSVQTPRKEGKVLHQTKAVTTNSMYQNFCGKEVSPASLAALQQQKLTREGISETPVKLHEG